MDKEELIKAAKHEKTIHTKERICVFLGLFFTFLLYATDVIFFAGAALVMCLGYYLVKRQLIPYNFGKLELTPMERKLLALDMGNTMRLAQIVFIEQKAKGGNRTYYNVLKDVEFNLTLMEQKGLIYRRNGHWYNTSYSTRSLFYYPDEYALKYLERYLKKYNRFKLQNLLYLEFGADGVDPEILHNMEKVPAMYPIKPQTIPNIMEELANIEKSREQFKEA